MVIRFLPEAEQDLSNAYDWYDSQQLGLGSRFVAAVREASFKCSSDPLSHELYLEFFRRRRVWGFPYDIVFHVDDGVLTIVAIRHHFRGTDDWRHRL